MITIEVTNNKCRLYGDIKLLMNIQKAFKVKNPNAYFIRLRGNVQSNWDGMIWYVTESNYFKIGLLPQVYNYIKNTLKEKVKFVDHRLDFNVKPKLPKKIGNLKPRDYQGVGIKALIENKVGDLNFPIGVYNAATNAGKTLLMAGVWLAYRKKIPALVLLNDGDLFEQFKREIPELIGKENFGYVRGKDAVWNNFTICMVQTVSQKIDIYKNQLSKFGILLVDEGDLANNKTYKTVLQQCSQANVRVCLSGSIFLSKLKKDFTNHQDLHSLFGETIFSITKKEMADLGYSTKVVVRMFKGSNKLGIKGDYKAEYDKGIMYNEDRAMESVKRMKANIKRKRLPAIIVCQFHNHIDLMYKVYQRELGDKYKIAYVHGDKKDRNAIFKDFREGKIDILISSFIIKRGKNFPLVKYLQNAAGSDSQETIWQIMGRLERTHESKNKAYMEDFYDEGFYLSRHSKHRINYYLDTGFKVIKKF